MNAKIFIRQTLFRQFKISLKPKMWKCLAYRTFPPEFCTWKHSQWNILRRINGRYDKNHIHFEICYLLANIVFRKLTFYYLTNWISRNAMVLLENDSVTTLPKQFVVNKDSNKKNSCPRDVGNENLITYRILTTSSARFICQPLIFDYRRFWCIYVGEILECKS